MENLSMLDLDKNVGFWWFCCCVWLEMRSVLLYEKNILEFGRVVQILKAMVFCDLCFSYLRGFYF
jgi:hypothetical protein